MPMKKLFTLLFLVCTFLISGKVYAVSGWYEISSYYGDKDAVKIFPNPMVTDATIRVSDDIDMENTKVSISFYNMVGSEVFRINQLKSNDIKILKDNFKNSGMYFYQLRVDDKIVTTGRITVR